MQQPDPGLPLFLNNSPQLTCEQILWLVINSNLNFQVKETPFGLSLDLKKRFVHHWNTDQFSHQVFSNPVPPQTTQTQQNFRQIFPESDRQNYPEQFETTQKSHCKDLVNQLELLKKSYEDEKNEKEDLEKDLVYLDKSHRKLIKDNKELQQKHEKILQGLRVAQAAVTERWPSRKIARK